MAFFKGGGGLEDPVSQVTLPMSETIAREIRGNLALVARKFHTPGIGGWQTLTGE